MLARLILAVLVIWVARVTGDCVKPPQLDNGALSDQDLLRTSFPVKTSVTYKCLPGYTFAEGSSRSITCRADSTWSPLRARCEPRNCGNPGEILNGYYEADATTFGNKVVFYCDNGYQIVGRNYRVCEASGWSGQVPTCEIVTCDDPPPISNGKATRPFSSEIWTYGMMAEYSCNDDYSLIGTRSLTCQGDGTWDNKPPECKAVECPRPATPENGYIESGFGQRKYKYQDEVVFRCREGFEMVGESIIKCSEDNIFVPSPPTCKPRDCVKPPQLDNGALSDQDLLRTSFSVGTSVTYKCLPGYTFVEGSSRSITCQADSTWSPLRARCEPRNCGNPGEILNGYYEADATTFGNKVVFYCDNGYQIVGRNYRVCEASGWSGQVPTCEIVTCDDPPPISNGKATRPFSSEIWTYGMMAEYSCNDDYSLIGTRSLTCQGDGTWDNKPPECKAVECPRPATPENGYIESGFGQRKYKYQDEVVFRCREGFEMVGESIIKCGEDNIFLPSPPTCKPRGSDIGSTAVTTTVATDVPKSKGLSTGATVGIILAVCCPLILGVLIWFYCKKKKERKYTSPKDVVMIAQSEQVEVKPNCADH
ncbi:membrane cofactor protein-like isoform X2 [Stegostoma tigrinum]|uniref:membrane cofactor protein-like isoform X2 n=1 Tax=Stegostoma tigrinum TaxID=3053191 RepID=UPI002870B2AD|nr:membrane cofactor protein-like isoform X2 [Stegostoma tigrinum]